MCVAGRGVELLCSFFFEARVLKCESGCERQPRCAGEDDDSSFAYSITLMRRARMRYRGSSTVKTAQPGERFRPVF